MPRRLFILLLQADTVGTETNNPGMDKLHLYIFSV